MEQVKKKGASWQVALIGLKLLLICAIVAGVVSFVYALTADQYEKNIRETKNQAIGEIFGRSELICEELPFDGEETVYDGETELYFASKRTARMIWVEKL